MKVIIACGGTGGHIYPSIGIARELENNIPKEDILFVGSRRGLENKIVTKFGYKITFIPVERLGSGLKLFKGLFYLTISFVYCLAIFLKYKPKIVVSTGGYASFPAAFAAYILRIPLLIHEQNVIPGLANRIAARFAKWVTLSFSESLKYIKGIVTGNPIRPEILKIKHSLSQRNNDHKAKVLILGGSQGSLNINETIIKFLPEFSKMNVEIDHVLGERDYPKLVENIDISKFPFYHPHSYLYNIEEAYRDKDLIVSRGGATAISEILFLGIPSILIPYPYAHKHQYKNVKAITQNGAGCFLDDSNLNELPALIKSCLKDNGRLEQMKKAAMAMAYPNAAKEIVKEIIGTINEN